MRVYIILFLAIVFVSCRQHDRYKEDDLFFDYRISAEEGSDSASVLVQFKLRRISGPALTLDNKSSIKFDDDTIPLGRSKVTGTYYALTRSVNDISGKHTLTYTSSTGKSYITHFEFYPFSLVSALPDTIRNGGLTVHFTDLDSLDHLQIIITDTSFKGEGVNKTFPVRNRELILSPGDLSKLNPGPLQFEIQHNTEMRINRGSLLMSYVMRKEIWFSRQ